MPRVKKIGLYFGSFNPIHMGHLIIAQSMLTHTDLQEIWFVVSPQNPLKQNTSLEKEEHRLQMVSLAVADNEFFKPCDAEFSLPRPSYTVDTLEYLREKCPEYLFCILMGGDNLESFHHWKSYEQIVEKHQLYVYPRMGYAIENNFLEELIQCKDFPYLDISSTYIREQIHAGKSIKYLVADSVWEYIKSKTLYGYCI